MKLRAPLWRLIPFNWQVSLCSNITRMSLNYFTSILDGFCLTVNLLTFIKNKETSPGVVLPVPLPSSKEFLKVTGKLTRVFFNARKFSAANVLSKVIFLVLQKMFFSLLLSKV